MRLSSFGPKRQVDEYALLYITMQQDRVYTAAVAGASGYAGGEVLRLLASHPNIKVTALTANTNAGEKIGTLHPHLVSLSSRVLEDTTPENLCGNDVVFLALPHGKSGELSESLSKLSPETIIVDCGADHRLTSKDAWDQFYGGAYFDPWTYGVPELITNNGKQRTRLKKTKRIAAPGCNASTVALSLAPGVNAGIIDPSDIVSVLAVGPSGAGKALKPNLLASEILGSASPYAVGGVHRHIPEICQALKGAVQDDIDVRISFTPVLVPMSRGILATSSVPIKPGVTEQELRKAWQDAYADEPFIHLLPAGHHPATASTVGANTVHMSVTLDEAAGRAVIIAALDNLYKGTAGAAIQSTNIALGLPETSGLTVNGVAP